MLPSPLASAPKEGLVSEKEMEVRLAIPKPGDVTSGANLRMGEGEQIAPGWDPPPLYLWTNRHGD